MDYWFAYKFHGGTDYALITSSKSAPPGPLRLTGLELDAPTSPLSRTLDQLASDRASLARVLWNDELPAAAAANATTSGSGTSGHTKGVLGSGAGGGFFLTHTLPKFPDLTGADAWASASTIYGQNFLCLTLAPAMIDAVALALQYDDIHAFDSAVPSALVPLLPNTVALVAGQRRAGTRATPLATSPGAVPFTQFSKSGSTGLDLYEDVVQPALGADMWVETWRRSPAMDTYCRPDHAFDSMNVQDLVFVGADGSNATWRYTQDHSKVAVAAPAPYLHPQPTVCVGDMNRMTSQWARGGGTTCLDDAALWSALVDSFATVDACAEA